MNGSSARPRVRRRRRRRRCGYEGRKDNLPPTASSLSLAVAARLVFLRPDRGRRGSIGVERVLFVKRDAMREYRGSISQQIAFVALRKKPVSLQVNSTDRWIQRFVLIDVLPTQRAALSSEGERGGEEE